ANVRPCPRRRLRSGRGRAGSPSPPCSGAVRPDRSRGAPGLRTARATPRRTARASGAFRSSQLVLRRRLDLSREAEIAIRHPALVVAREGDGHLRILDEDVGMVVGAVGELADGAGEGHRRLESLEVVRPDDRLSLPLPAGQLLERRLDLRFGGQTLLLGHERSFGYGKPGLCDFYTGPAGIACAPASRIASKPVPCRLPRP